MRLMELAPKIFGRDSPLEEAGFEPSVPRGAIKVSRGDDRIREAVSPSFRGYAAGNLRPVLLVQSRPTSPVMLVHLFETREEAETWMAAW